MSSLTIFGHAYRMKKGYLTGTHRTRSPRDTLADYARWMPLMGITRLANLTGLDTIGLPVYTAIRPNARALATSQGKGCDADAAKISAFMESIESWHSAFMESIESWHAERIAQPLRWESCVALRDAVPVVDVTQLLLRTDGELYPDLRMLWIEGYDLIQQQPTWVPYETVSTN